MPFAFIDESGSPSPFGAGRYLAVAVLVVENVRPIEFMVRAVRRRLSRQSATAELKAARSDSRIVRSVLGALSNIDCQVYGAVLDKRGMEVSIREAIADVIGQVVTVEQHSSHEVPGLQAADFLAWAIRQEAEGAREWVDIIRARVMGIEGIEGKRRAAPPGGR